MDFIRQYVRIVDSYKDNNLADKLREEGNAFLAEGKFFKSLKKYNESLCNAEKSSESMGYAYANRSAVYLKLKQYKNCIENVNLAILNGYPVNKQNKLMHRLNACEDKLLKQSEEEEDNPEYEFKLSYDPNPKIPSIANCLELKINDEYGHHIVTNRKLLAGDVIVIEEFFLQLVTSKVPNFPSDYADMYFIVCAYCLNINELNLIPCYGCNHTMYCSTECQEKANAEYHNLECELMETLVGRENVLAIRLFFKSLSICDGNIEELQQLIKSIDGKPRLTIFDCDHTKLSTDKLKRKLLLVASSGLHNTGDAKNVLFTICRIGLVAIIETLLRNYSKTSAMMKTHGNFIMQFIERLIKIEQVNAHNTCKRLPIDGMKQVSIGNAYSLFVSLFNHSCSENVLCAQFKKSNVLVVNQTIKAGEQIFINYGYHYTDMVKSIRQKSLQSSYNFKCNCVACKNNYPKLTEIVKSNDEIAMIVKTQMDMLIKLSNTVGVKTEMIKVMLKECIKTLESISNVNRTAYDNRVDVIGLRELLRRLMVVCDDTQLTIRK